MFRRNPNGYSLIDVLVIVVLVALITIIVLPIFAHLRAADKREACANNLNQLAKAMFMYADVPVNHDHFPTRGTKDDAYDDNKPLVALNFLYNKFIVDPRVFVCPSAPPGIPDKFPELNAEQIAKFNAALKQMGADDFETREKGAKIIRELGLGAHPKLGEAFKSATDPEVKTRIVKMQYDLTEGVLVERLKKLAVTPIRGQPKDGDVLSADSSSYGYDPGHNSNDALAAIMGDRKGAGKNSDNHGANAGQNVLIGAGVIEFMESPERKLGADKVDPDIFAKNASDKLPREMDGFIRQ